MCFEKIIFSQNLHTCFMNKCDILDHYTLKIQTPWYNLMTNNTNFTFYLNVQYILRICTTEHLMIYLKIML